MDINGVIGINNQLQKIPLNGLTYETDIQNNNPQDGSSESTSSTTSAQKDHQSVDIKEKMKQVNKVFEDLNKGVHYQLVEKHGRPVMQLVQKEDKKVIYQMPPEGILEAAEKLNEAVGLIMDHKK